MGPPPPTPRAPPPTPMSPRYSGSTSSSSSSGTSTGTSSSSSSSSSYTTSEYSYFSPHTPMTGSTPNSPYIQAPPPHSLSTSLGPPQTNSSAHSYSHSTELTRPIIAGFVTSSRGGGAMHSQPVHHSYSQGYQQPAYHRLNPQHHTHPPPPPSEVLQQFALHIPSPPPLSMPSKMTSRLPSGGQQTSPSGQQQQPGQQQAPEMGCRSEPGQYMLNVLLPRGISPEMVTISANKGDRLRVVAQAWHGQDESHYEWQISFPPHDVDLSKVQAKFDPDGCLNIRVPRWSRGAVMMMGR